MSQSTLPPDQSTEGPPSNGASPDGTTTVRRPRPALRSRAKSGGKGEQAPRSSRAFALSVALHVVVGVVVLQLLTFGHGLYSFLDPFRTREPVEERLTYVEPKADAPAPVPPPAAPAVPRTAAAAPVSTGPVVGAPPVGGQPLGSVTPDTASGPPVGSASTGVGAVDPRLVGAKPGYPDGRIWAQPGAIERGRGRDGAERLDSVIASVLTQAADSLDSIARATGRYAKAPGDWTRTDKDGKKWGWDNKGIRLGKVVIPNALLSLLPLNTQAAMSGNASSIDRERRLATSREDIMRNMTMGPGDAEFDKLNKELRQRRERERRDRLRAPVLARGEGK